MVQMILPDPVVFAKPLHVWLGMVTFLFVIIQILIGTRLLKIPFWVHTKVIWVIILALALLHGFYGFQLYFLK